MKIQNQTIIFLITSQNFTNHASANVKLVITKEMKTIIIVQNVETIIFQGRMKKIQLTAF